MTAAATKTTALAAAGLAALTACAMDGGGAIDGGGAPAELAFSQTLADGVQGDPAAAADGAALYAELCAACHDAAGMGTGLLARRVDPALLTDREDLTADYVTLAVRSGIGNMPRISRAEASDAQLAAIADYLTAAEEE